jgi:hypothetical protein
MKLTNLILELRYGNVGRQFNWKEEFLKKITGKDHAAASPIVSEGFNIEIKDKKAVLEIEPKRLSISVFEPGDQIKICSDFFDSVLNKVTPSIGWLEGIRIGIRMVWAEEVVGDYDTLIDKIRNKVFVNNTLISSAKDVAIPLTLVDGDSSINFNAGLMKKDQFKNVYVNQRINAVDLPEIMAIIDIDYFMQSNKVFDSKFVRNFVEKGYEYGKIKMEEAKKLSFNFMGVATLDTCTRFGKAAFSGQTIIPGGIYKIPNDIIYIESWSDDSALSSYTKKISAPLGLRIFNLVMGAVVIFSITGLVLSLFHVWAMYPFVFVVMGVGSFGLFRVFGRVECVIKRKINAKKY